MFRGLAVSITLFALLFTWVSPCIDVTDAFGACGQDNPELVCDDDSKGESSGNPSDEDLDEFAKDFDWILKPLNFKISLVESGFVFTPSILFSSIFHSTQERPPRA